MEEYQSYLVYHAFGPLWSLISPLLQCLETRHRWVLWPAAPTSRRTFWSKLWERKTKQINSQLFGPRQKEKTFEEIRLTVRPTGNAALPDFTIQFWLKINWKETPTKKQIGEAAEVRPGGWGPVSRLTVQQKEQCESLLGEESECSPDTRSSFIGRSCQDARCTQGRCTTAPTIHWNLQIL